MIALDHPHAPVASQAHQIGKVPVASWKAFHACQPTDGNLRVWFGIGTPQTEVEVEERRLRALEQDPLTGLRLS